MNGVSLPFGVADSRLMLWANAMSPSASIDRLRDLELDRPVERRQPGAQPFDVAPLRRTRGGASEKLTRSSVNSAPSASASRARMARSRSARTARMSVSAVVVVVVMIFSFVSSSIGTSTRDVEADVSVSTYRVRRFTQRWRQ